MGIPINVHDTEFKVNHWDIAINLSIFRKTSLEQIKKFTQFLFAFTTNICRLYIHSKASPKSSTHASREIKSC